MPWFAATIFLSAFLLFFVQPLIARYILPWFGGAPAVWTTCMLFFQVALLAGYAYADLVTRVLSRRQQVAVHLGLLVLSLAMLPIIPAEAWKPVGGEPPVWQILGLLLTTIGAPYFLLSTTGPLFQSWFAASYPGRSPYRLYALSNVGSLLALLAYPFWFERFFGSRPQAIWWSVGFGIFVVFAGLCGWTMLRALAKDNLTPELDGVEAELAGGVPAERNRTEFNSPLHSGGHWLSWLILALLPSVLLLAVTNQLCQEIASIPFLWIVPLALYLISFIICFDAPRWYRRDWYLTATALLSGYVIYATCKPEWVSYVGQVFVFPAYLFCAAMLCHGELARQKPDPKHLTRYFLLISLGGAIGGVFVVLIAPRIFSQFFELHLAIMGALLAGVWSVWGDRDWPSLRRAFYVVSYVGASAALLVVGFMLPEFLGTRWAWFGFVGIWLIVGVATADWMGQRSEDFKRSAQGQEESKVNKNEVFAAITFMLWGLLLGVAVMNTRFAVEWLLPVFVVALQGLMLCAVLSRKMSWPRVPVGAMLLSVLLALVIGGGFLVRDALTPDRGLIAQRRDFYGLASVTEEESNDRQIGKVKMIKSGRINHGFQYTGERLRRTPTSYYGNLSGISKAFQFHPRRQGEVRPMRIGVIGLGVGTIAAFGKPGDKITFFEINPEMEKLAQEHFTYLSDSMAECSVVLGDGRLMLEQAAANGEFERYDMLVVDAFSGDSIPRHLLTKESFELYNRVLEEDGVLAINVTHPYFRLMRVVKSQADLIGIQPFYIFGNTSTIQGNMYETDSKWAILTRNPLLAENADFLKFVSEDDHGDPLLWTDDFGSLAQVLVLPKPNFWPGFLWPW